jgi:hypothetical protein
MSPVLALMHPHWQQTREQIAQEPVVVLVQDTTEGDLSQHPHTTGLGQVGHERGGGLDLQTVLAILPPSGAVVGGARQEPWVRVPAPAGETRSQRRQRQERETDVWMRLVRRLGSFPTQTTVVQVGDRGADLFPFFQACQATQTRFLVRAFENRQIAPEERPQRHLRGGTCVPGQPLPAAPCTCLPVMDARRARPGSSWPLVRSLSGRLAASRAAAKRRCWGGPSGSGKSRPLREL